MAEPEEKETGRRVMTAASAFEEMKRAMVDCGIPLPKIREVVKLYKERNPWRSRIPDLERRPGILFTGERKRGLSPEGLKAISDWSKRARERGDFDEPEGDCTAGSPEMLKLFGELPPEK